MKELLDYSKVEVDAAQWFIDEERQQYVNVDGETLEQMFGEFMEIHSFIGRVQSDLKWNCLFIGWALKDILDRRLYNYVRNKTSYSMHGYTSFYKFVKEVYGIKERTAKRMVAVAREFCQASDTTGVSEERLKTLPVCQLKLAYVNYSYSQLAELMGIEEQYRPRIPVSASVRDIQKVSKLYKSGYVPRALDTYQDDVQEYVKRQKEEKEKKNSEQKRLTFVPAKTVPTLALEKETFEDDERDISTPTEERKVELEAIRSGLSAQLELLKRNYPEWEGFAIRAKYALEEEKPDLLSLPNKNSTLAQGCAAKGKLSLKNEKERKEWLSNYRSWGVWLDVPQVSKRYYRYDFVNGASVVVEENQELFMYATKPTTFTRYAILDKSCPTFCEGRVGGGSGVVTWLTKHVKEI